MKKIIAGLIAAGIATAAYAACTTQTYFINGKYTTCTTCCDSFGNCNTTCF